MTAHTISELSESLQSLREECDLELKRILDFWSDQVYLPAGNSFVGRIDHFGTKHPQADLGAVLVSRILWTFSAAYKIYPLEKYKAVADAAYNLVTGNFWDTQYGGLFWSLNAKGQVSNSRKQAYAQGFGIYGLSEYFDAFGQSEALDRAWELYQLLEGEFRDPEAEGYWEARGQDLSPIEDLKLSEKDANVPKSMNTHLHILEPYSNLYRIDPKPELRDRLASIVNLFLDRIINPETGHFDLFFSKDWARLSKIHSYGHDIEGAWLLREASVLLDNPSLKERVDQASLRLVELTMKEGSGSDGSLYNERDEHELDTEKHWWPQAEALVGYLDAFEITWDSTYIVRALRVWYFIQMHLIDRDKGEWFWRVDKKGQPIESEDKAGFWKCPYHNSRALMETIRRIDEITS